MTFNVAVNSTSLAVDAAYTVTSDGPSSTAELVSGALVYVRVFAESAGAHLSVSVPVAACLAVLSVPDPR
jgi:hypothetical protein